MVVGTKYTVKSKTYNMARLLSSLNELDEGSVAIVYDMEAVGNVNRPQTCYSWNLSAMVLGKPRHVFDQFIVPPLAQLPDKPNEKLFEVTHAFLKKSNAILMSSALDLFWKWVSTLKPDGGSVLMIAHGNFRFDKLLFEAEHHRYCQHIPHNVYFFDTLHWFRQIMPKQRSYALNNIYKMLFFEEINNQHLSLYDVYALNRCVTQLRQTHLFSGVVYPPFATPLIRIPGVGLHTQRLLIDKNFFSADDLYFVLMNTHQADASRFHQHLCNEGIQPQTCTSIIAFLRSF